MFHVNTCSKNKTHPCDSIQAQFDQALVLLDSLMGNQNESQKQLDETQLDISKLKNEISSLLKEKNDTMTDLNNARKLIIEQMEKIKELDVEVKRLSAPGKSSDKKGT